MKKLLLSIFAAATISAAATPSFEITTSDLQWTIGNEWYMKVTTGKSISDFTSTGTNVSWDFTSYETSVINDTIKAKAATSGTGSTVSISSSIIPNTNYKLNGSDYEVTAISYNNTNYPLDGTLSIGLSHYENNTWSSSTTGLTIVPISVSGSVLATGAITTSYGTFDAVLVQDNYNIAGNSVTYYYWETKEYGRIATLIDGKFSLMTQNNFSAITSNNEVALNEANIYPNPATDILTVSVNGLENVSIYNALGSLVIQQTATNNSAFVDVSALKAGVYFVQANASGTIQTSRVVVK